VCCGCAEGGRGGGAWCVNAPHRQVAPACRASHHHHSASPVCTVHPDVINSHNHILLTSSSELTSTLYYSDCLVELGSKCWCLCHTSGAVAGSIVPCCTVERALLQDVLLLNGVWDLLCCPATVFACVVQTCSTGQSRYSSMCEAMHSTVLAQTDARRGVSHWQGDVVLSTLKGVVDDLGPAWLRLSQTHNVATPWHCGRALRHACNAFCSHPVEFVGVDDTIAQ